MTGQATKTWWGQNLVKALQRLTPADQRGWNRSVLAELRRCDGTAPPSPAAIGVILRAMPSTSSPRRMRDALLIANLYARHPKHSNAISNVGASLGKLRKERHGSAEDAPVDQRMKVLVATDRDGLTYHLRQAVALLATKDIPINYEQLLSDLIGWSDTKITMSGLPRAEEIRLRWLAEFDRAAHVRTPSHESQEEDQ